MEDSFLALVRADVSVADILGARIHWVRRPQDQDALPACVLQRITGLPGYHTKGPDGLVKSRVQIDVWGETYTSCKAAARSIISAISGYSGEVSGTKFQGIFIDGNRDMPDEDNDANNRLFRVSIDALIWHTE